MSVARPIFKRVKLMLTRRVRGRTLLLRPSKRTDQIVGYVVAVMSKRWNIKVHALIVLGNHYHATCEDPDGAIVDFQRDTHHFITKGINAHHGEFEAMWASQPTSRVACEEPDDMINKIAYAMANPVEAGLVRYGSRWPGLRRAWPSKPRTFKRPPKYFRGPDQGGGWPDEATLEFERPSGYEALSDDELAGVIRTAIDDREQTFRDERDAAGKRFLGRRNVLAQSRHSQPRTREPRFGISPTVACRNKWLRIERLKANKLWRADYRTALARWRAGDRNVEFPHGTYRMR
ncbi:MAG TPA: hypothetical protein VML75_14705, partial [Kofleriaceae bacterium]|nr:hypothetical protein [Kofleriaceae bacterium]